VIDNIYLGGYRSAEDLDLLRSFNITHVVVCGEGLECPFRGEGIKYLVFEIFDHELESITPCFAPTHEFILSAKTTSGSTTDIDSNKINQPLAEGAVLIHCYAGVSRSATVVISYLMKYHGMTCDVAKSYLKSKRRCICPNEGFMRQLYEYEQHLSQNL